jgi:hypothetical protein
MAEELTAEEKAELARIRAEKEKARREACIEKAHAASERAAGLLSDMNHGVTDEERIEAMGVLREAINHLNEAG